MDNNKKISTMEQILSPDIKKELLSSEESWISDIKSNSFELLANRGLPTLKNEKWKYTDISQIYKYNIIPEKNSDTLILDDISNLFSKKIFPVNLVFINGCFMKDLSETGKLPEGIKIKEISQGIKDKDPVLKKYLTNSTDVLEDSFVSLNNLFFENGVYIHIDKDIEINTPIHINYINNSDLDFSSQHPRNLIIAETGSKVSILEEFYRNGNKHNFTNHVIEVFTEKEAEVSHYLLQNKNKQSIQISTLSVRQKESSKFSSQVISIGGGLIRNNIHSKLIGEKASCLMNGVYILNGKQHLDNFTSIDHIDPNCTSSQLYHGILSDKSRGIFTGKIHVHEKADNTLSDQTNRSLMLSEESHVDAKPQLEIFNEDVKCSHAATIGQLDEDNMYYLRSRGIEHKEAKKMLSLAFSHKITQLYENKQIRTKMEELIVNKMDSLEEAEL